MSKLDAGQTVAVETPRLDTLDLHKRHASLIVVQGVEIGRDYRLRQSKISLGRGVGVDVRLRDDQSSRLHAAIERVWDNDNGAHHVLSDTRSTNGTFVNGRPVTETTLSDGDKIQIGDTVLKFVLLDRIDASFHAEVRDRINYDALTGLLTKESLYIALEDEIGRCREYGHSLAVLMMDLDRFKSVNDSHGHPMGSHMLAEVGKLIRAHIREVDVSGRYGGEEFVAYLAETDLGGAHRAAERVRVAIEAHEFELNGAKSGITISIGIAIMPQHGCHLDTLVEVADRALYDAKNAGRNRVLSA